MMYREEGLTADEWNVCARLCVCACVKYLLVVSLVMLYMAELDTAVGYCVSSLDTSSGLPVLVLATQERFSFYMRNW